MKKVNCTQTVVGCVRERKSKGLNHPTMITVEYQVGGNIYRVTESIKLKCEMIKLGFLPIALRKIPVMGDTVVGSSAMVSYNPSNPKEAFITYNIGWINV